VGLADFQSCHRPSESDLPTTQPSQAVRLTSFLPYLFFVFLSHRSIQRYLTVTQPSRWANESFQYVRTTVYNFTQSGEGSSFSTLSATNIDPSLLSGYNIEDYDYSLGQWYYNTNLPVVQQRLIAAAVRLAALLNSIFQ